MLNIKKNILLKDFTTFKIGGRAEFFTKVSNVSQIKEAVSFAKKKNLPLFLLGGGSNILFPDKGYKGIVLKLENQETNFEGNNVTAGAGVLFLKLILSAKEKSLGGLEWGAGIPGTVGGAIYGNVGAFGGEIKDNLKEILALDKKTLGEKTLKNKDCGFSYRNSIFKKEQKYIILSATFTLEKKDKKEVGDVIRENILYRKKNHPLELPSAGSIFRNIKTTSIKPAIFRKFPDLGNFRNKNEIPAGYLIDKAGLKGKRVGGAKVSEKHTNFIVNTGEAKSRDVVSLINLIKDKVRNKFDIELKEEVIII